MLPRSYLHSYFCCVSGCLIFFFNVTVFLISSLPFRWPSLAIISASLVFIFNISVFVFSGNVSVLTGGAAPVRPPAGGERGSGAGELSSGWRRTWRRPGWSGTSRRSQWPAARPPREKSWLQELLLEDLHLLLRTSFIILPSSSSLLLLLDTVQTLYGSDRRWLVWMNCLELILSECKADETIFNCWFE